MLPYRQSIINSNFINLLAYAPKPLNRDIPERQTTAQLRRVRLTIARPLNNLLVHFIQKLKGEVRLGRQKQTGYEKAQTKSEAPRSKPAL